MHMSSGEGGSEGGRGLRQPWWKWVDQSRDGGRVLSPPLCPSDKDRLVPQVSLSERKARHEARRDA